MGPLESYVQRIDRAVGALAIRDVEKLATMILETAERGGRVYTLGNGGSASSASHMAADLGKSSSSAGARPVPCFCLSDSIPTLTAVANDDGYGEVFAAQVRRVVDAGDLVIAMTASGNSPNVLHAMKTARDRGALVAALLGFDGGAAAGLADLAIVVRSDSYGVVEDLHLIINHMLAEYLRAVAR